MPAFPWLLIADAEGFNLANHAGLYAVALERIFKWDFNSILPCHGEHVPEDGKKVLQNHLQFAREHKRLISH
jgi:hypothetical protein